MEWYKDITHFKVGYKNAFNDLFLNHLHTFQIKTPNVNRVFTLWYCITPLPPPPNSVVITFVDVSAYLSANSIYITFP